MIKLFYKNGKGFTIIESLLGCTIILIAILGPLTVSMNGIKSLSQSKNRIIASYLAEEMMEELYNYRDSYMVACQTYTPIIAGTDFISASCGSLDPDSPDSPDSLGILDVSDVADITSSAQDVAWKMFLKSLSLLSDDSIIFEGSKSLDQSSFSYTNNIPQILQTYNCSESLYLNSENYACLNSGGTPTGFDRAIILTKISATAIKVEVEVVYSQSQFAFGKNDSVFLVDYIYSR